MAFDQGTRNRLQRLVSDCRKTLTDEFTLQLQQDYGLDPRTGEVTELSRLTRLSDRERHTAALLRETLAHYLAGEGESKAKRQAAIDRIIREQAFTVLNRLAALLMMEARGLLLPAVSQGTQSQAFELYRHVAGIALGETGEAYQTFLFSLFDEFALDLPALFDRFAPQGRLFPRETALNTLLALLNDHEIEPLWALDETIGWIYQYFNSQEERKAMRKASQAPRNSRELAVRNQFFTPRYVVEFLVDNTLGRQWFNATGGTTLLRDSCQYLLVKPDEQPEAGIKLRDPRTLKLLDPACGSMHFGLYAFDLFLQIYRDAWQWEQQHGPGSLDLSTQPEAGFEPLCHTYADEEALLRDVPRLIIEHNIYGVDIDPRAAQIASLALWLRAQRAWHEAGVQAMERPDVGQGNVIAAVAPPAEKELREAFMARLDRQDAELFEKTLQMLKGLPELGVLLRAEKELPALIHQVYVGKGSDLFAEQEQETWQKAEERLRRALLEFSEEAGATYQSRLFAQDVLQGLRMIDLCRVIFDVVVMNPPFGEYSTNSKEYCKKHFHSGGHDIITAFVERCLSLISESGRIGAITSRTCFFSPSARSWREKVVLSKGVELWVDMGPDVLDGAMVETCMFSISANASRASVFIDASEAPVLDVVRGFSASSSLSGVYEVDQEDFNNESGSQFSYWKSGEVRSSEKNNKKLKDLGVSVKVGLQTGNDFRFLRCWWEMPKKKAGWFFHAKGGSNEPFVSDIHLLVNWEEDGREVRSYPSVRLNMFSKKSPDDGVPAGLTFAYRTFRFSPGLMPRNVVPGVAGMGVYSKDINLFSLLAVLNSNAVNELINMRLANKKSQALYQAGVISPVTFPELTEAELSQLKQLSVNICNNILVKLFNDRASLIFSGYFFDPSGLARTSCLINDHWGVCLDSVGESYEDLDKIVLSSYGLSYEEIGLSGCSPCADVFQALPKTISTPEGELGKLVTLAFDKLFVGGSIDVFDDIGKVRLPDLDDYMEGRSFLRSYEGSLAKGVSCVTTYDVEEEIADLVESCFEEPDVVFAEAVELSGRKSFHDYIESPAGFFSYHFQCFSKSRRKAPIYWPLSTSSGTYTLWLYYLDLTDQTLFTAVNDFVEPKLKQVETELGNLRLAGASRSRADEKRLEELSDFRDELADLRDTLLRIAPDYKPNQDDGVQITAAPLWPLFRHKPWQKVLKETWEKLEQGDYDWAHLAMAYWPERVREKCVTDKSLAIAHDLEHLYVEPEPVAKKTRGRKKNTGGSE
ncbi:BREX-1 system adenine-specific DNA-methyltransferase PglX [Halomonas sp.]|uniref:BREX-1 system adenine-specific DNA-methyltransferase PglX n=1 Tax=Halomonas sp. TaxID=1486246 RepID=UPI0035636514